MSELRIGDGFGFGGIVVFVVKRGGIGEYLVVFDRRVFSNMENFYGLFRYKSAFGLGVGRKVGVFFWVGFIF